MKAFFAVLLVICAASATRNWVGVPEKHLKKLDNLLKDTKDVTSGMRFGSKVAFGNLLKGAAKYSAKQNDHQEEDGSGEGSGLSPTEKPENPISNLVDVIHKILPDLNELREASEKQASAYAKEFVTALKNEKDDNKVKALFGKHARLLFTSCNDKLVEFAKKAHESGLFKQIRHDFGSIMGEVVAKAEGGASFVVEFFKAVGKHNLGGHPVMKLLVKFGELIGDAACDFDLDGFMKAIGSEMKEHERENVEEDEGRGKDLRCRKAKMVLRVIRTCSAVKRKLNESPGKGLMDRAKRLLFQGGCSFQEGLCVTDTLDIIKDLIKLHIKFVTLAYKANLRKKDMVAKMVSLHVKGEQEKADLMLANYILGEMRQGMLVGFYLFQKREGDEPRQTTLKDKAADNHPRLKM